MGIEMLGPLEIVHGSFTLAFVLLSIIIGIRMVTKYAKSKHFEHITLGLGWIFLSSAWWGSAFSFLTIIFIGDAIGEIIFLFIGNAFIPLAIIFWLYSFSTILFPDKKKMLMSIILLICIPYEIVLITFLIIDPSVVGTIEGTFYSRPNILSAVFQAFALVVTIITGVIFSLQSMKVDKPEVKWRGRFLLLAFFSLTIGSLLDIFIAREAFSLVIIRLVLMASAIEYYLGFFLPEKLANWLIK